MVLTAVGAWQYRTAGLITSADILIFIRDHKLTSSLRSFEIFENSSITHPAGGKAGYNSFTRRSPRVIIINLISQISFFKTP